MTLRKQWPAIRLILISAVVSAVVSLSVSLAAFQIEQIWSRPRIRVVGALPLHIRKEQRFGSLQFNDHMLAIILKIENTSSAPIPVSHALISGCSHMDALSADFSLPPEEQWHGDVNKLLDAPEIAVQRLSVSGEVRSDTSVAVAYGVSYIGVLFRLRLGRSGASLLIPGTVSRDGECTKLALANPQPSAALIFDWDSRGPTAIRHEFFEGGLSLLLFVGTERVKVDPEMIQHSLDTVLLPTWDKLQLGQMYENPDSSYPPTTEPE